MARQPFPTGSGSAIGLDWIGFPLVMSSITWYRTCIHSLHNRLHPILEIIKLIKFADSHADF